MLWSICQAVSELVGVDILEGQLPNGVQVFLNSNHIFM